MLIASSQQRHCDGLRGAEIMLWIVGNRRSGTLTKPWLCRRSSCGLSGIAAQVHRESPTIAGWVLWIVGNRRSGTLITDASTFKPRLWIVGNRRSGTRRPRPRRGMPCCGLSGITAQVHRRRLQRA